MEDELWGNAWGSTTESKAHPPSSGIKKSSSPNLTPAWPTTSVPATGLSDAWGTSAWGASNAGADDSGGGWGDSLEYDNQALEPVALRTESDVAVELKEEEVIEHEQEVYLSSTEHQSDIPHSPLPSSPPLEGSQTTNSRSSSPSADPPDQLSLDEPSHEPPVTPRISQHVVPTSPPRHDLDDSFGGFETGNKARLRVAAGTEEDPWSPAAGDLTFPPIQVPSQVEGDPAASDDAWESEWHSKDDEAPAEVGPADEWERARAKKERKDLKIPPEVVSGYLSNWESVVTEIWPEAPLPRSEPSVEWRSPLEEVSELQTLRKLYRLPTLTTTLSSPPPTLAPLPPFSSTQIHTRQRAALKATRVSAVAQLSPFAHLTSARSIQAAHRFSSRSSLSISKSSLEFGDGVVGVGWAWAHNEKKPEPTPVVVPPVAPMATVTASTPSPSPTPSTPTGRFSGFWARARGSTDRLSVGQGSRSNTPVPLTSPSTSSLTESTNNTKPDPEPAADSSPQPQPASAQPAPAEPTTSSVSRFFKRFSRSNPLESERTRLAVSESVSLSASDLEFLADSVPDTTEKSLLDGGRGLTEFDALEAMLRSKPLPKEVPILAPPPRIGSSNTSSPLAAVPENSKAGEDDLWDIFGAPPATNGRPNAPLLPSPVAPERRGSAPVTAPALSPKLTTPISSAPASRSHTPRLPSAVDISTIVGRRGSHLRQTSFSGQAQPAFRADVPSLDSPPIPMLPPPPGSTGAPVSLMEADPFADFVSAPAPSQVEASSARLSFDDFGDFESSAPVQSTPAPHISHPIISSPSPPKPPSKTGTPVFVRTGTNIQRLDSPKVPVTPPPLLPPPTFSGRSITPSSIPVIAPPPGISHNPMPQANLFDFGSSPPKNMPIPAPAFTQSSAAPTKGGLSATDLSFFEGL
ncbi:MFS general substrate transporter [Ceratobasidium theobromae]|uniref:MFS general substrate transporter n=1 Tax=Ceratobasidium theobromae TaxID=1582974 RepID=A0A5N5QMF0_9AGAM|nr:MFS general substrate transporter [Ceratobasidium theobromae]